MNVALGLDTADALATLRARAFVTGRDVDDVAEDLVADRLPAQHLAPRCDDTG